MSEDETKRDCVLPLAKQLFMQMVQCIDPVNNKIYAPDPKICIAIAEIWYESQKQYAQEMADKGEAPL